MFQENACHRAKPGDINSDKSDDDGIQRFVCETFINSVRDVCAFVFSYWQDVVLRGQNSTPNKTGLSWGNLKWALR